MEFLEMINAQNRLIEFLQSKHHVEGLTHSFYRYPARFAPEFVREAIMQFSSEGDCVLDTFMGGGTTIVEAIAAGRSTLGTDINPLAHFITAAKTTPLSSRDREAILCWASRLNIDGLNQYSPVISDPRLRNVPAEIRDFLISATSSVGQLEFPRQRCFVRCALVRLGQWAIDCRTCIPSAEIMKTQLLTHMSDMLKGLDELVQAAKNSGVSKNRITTRRKLYCGTIQEAMQNNDFAKSLPRPKLVLTSPPYPGVHMLYHRWQVYGRRETPAPYWLADLRDGHGESFYTFGGRSQKGVEHYFLRLAETFNATREFIDPSALIVQLVAFSDPAAHLPAFLRAMNCAGYEELTPFGGSNSDRPVRRVPNRKWYTQLGASQCASNEILLFHRPRT
jgi:DNA modification methylase